MCVTGVLIAAVVASAWEPLAFFPILVVTGMAAVGIAVVYQVRQLYHATTHWKELSSSTPVKVAVASTLAVFTIKVALTTSPWAIAVLLYKVFADIIFGLPSFLWNLAVCLDRILSMTIVILASFVWHVVAFLDDILANAIVGFVSVAFEIARINLEFYALMIREEPFWGTLFFLVPVICKVFLLCTTKTHEPGAAATTQETKFGPRVAMQKNPTCTPTTVMPNKPDPSTAAMPKTSAPTVVMPEKSAQSASSVEPQVNIGKKSTSRFCLYDEDDDQDPAIMEKLNTMSAKELRYCGELAGLDLYVAIKKGDLVQKLLRNDRIELILKRLEFAQL